MACKVFEDGDISKYWCSIKVKNQKKASIELSMSMLINLILGIIVFLMSLMFIANVIMRMNK
jgi:hypothetical protein